MRQVDVMARAIRKSMRHTATTYAGIGTQKRFAVALIAMALLTNGCAAQNGKRYFWANLGFRPNPPLFEKPASCDEEFAEYVNYSYELDEAYRSRATQNRGWIYVAGIFGIGTAAATGGLGIAGAAGVTLALLSISGGAVSGSFAIIDNSTLADVYTVCANEIATAISEAKAIAAKKCSDGLNHLDAKVTDARNKLESARTNNAVAAAIRAKNELETLNKELDEAKKALGTPTVTVTATSAVPQITPTAKAVDAPPADDEGEGDEAEGDDGE